MQGELLGFLPIPEAWLGGHELYEAHESSGGCCPGTDTRTISRVVAAVERWHVEEGTCANLYKLLTLYQFHSRKFEENCSA